MNLSTVSTALCAAAASVDAAEFRNHCFAEQFGPPGVLRCPQSHFSPFLATLLAVVLSIQVANAVLTTVVADQSVARTQSTETVAKMALASDVVVVQVSRQLLTPRGRSPTTDPRKITQCLAREGQRQSAKEMQHRSRLENSKTLYYLTGVDESPAHNDHDHTGDSL